MGAPAARAGRIEGFVEDDVTRLLGDETFRNIVEAYRGLHELPHGEALLRLLKISMGVIEEAVMEGRNAHVAAWVMWMAERGLDPAMTLAQQVVRAVERSGTATLLATGAAPARPAEPLAKSPPPARPRPAPTLGQRVRRGLLRTGARLGEAVMGEIAAEATAARGERAVEAINARAERAIDGAPPKTAKTARRTRRSSPVPSPRRVSAAPIASTPANPRHTAQPARASP